MKKLQPEELSHILQCQIGFKRLYFDLTTIHAILQAIESHYPTLNYFLSPDYLTLHHKGLKFLHKGRAVYQTIQKNRVNTFTVDDLARINQVLYQAYQIRTDLFAYLHQLFEHEELNFIDAEIDRIHIRIEDKNHIEDSIRLGFESRLNVFFTTTFPTHFKDLLNTKIIEPAQDEKIMNDLVKKVVPDFFGTYFTLAYRWQLRIFLLRAWESHMGKLLDKSPDLQNNTSLNIAQVVKLQDILCNQKSAFFISFYTHAQRYHHSVLTELYARIQENADPKTVLEKIEKDYQILLKNLNQKELQLKQYSWPQAIAAGSVRAPFNSYYYLVSESLMRIGEEFTQTSAMQQVPILNEPLSEEYIKFFSIIGGLLLFGLDYYTSTRLTGMSYTSLHALTQTILSDLTPLLSILDRVNGDEQSLADHMPKLQWLVGLSVHLGFHALLFGAGTENIGFFTISYCCATAARALVGVGFEAGKTWDKMHHFSQSMPRGFAFVKGISQGLGYSAGNLLCYQYQDQIRSYFTTPDVATLLSDEKLCQVHAKDCQSAALDRLDLPHNATFKQVKSHWHNLSKELHPDRLAHSNLSANEKAARQEEYMQLAHAYERLEKLPLRYKK